MAAAPPLLHVYQAPAQSFPDLKTTRRGFLVSKVRVIKKRSDEKHDSLERNSYNNKQECGSFGDTLLTMMMLVVSCFGCVV